MSSDTAVLGFVGGVAASVVLSCVADTCINAGDRLKLPFERLPAKISSLFNTMVFAAVDLPGDITGALFWESFCSSICSLHPGEKCPIVIVGSTASGVLIGYSVDQIVKETLRTFLQAEPGILVNVGAGILAWKTSTTVARNLSKFIWSHLGGRLSN